LGKAAAKKQRRTDRKPRPPGHGQKRRSGHSSEPSPRAIEGVLAAFAHDVRTPLTGILAFSELLATSDLGERERRWAAAIKDAAEHLTTLTTLVIEGARAGAGRLSLRREVFDLTRLGAALADSLASRAETKNLAWQVDLGEGLPSYVRGDPAQLRTALENLIANAVKFTERGEIGLKIAAVSRAGAPRNGSSNKLILSFTVTDSGIGISAAEIKRLFRPFAQANRDIVQKFGGSGLGLVQVRRLAKAMRGDLEVESAPGRGSTFRLSVEVERAEPPAAGHAFGAGEHGAPLRRPLHILCVEDNPYGRVVLNAILGEFGHRVDFVGSGEAAVEAAARVGHDVVLMDIALSGIDGFEAVRHIRALPGPAGRVPVIGISGHSDLADAERALASGMNGYLAKPVSPRALSEILSRIDDG
jgi:two-component system, sensor histidine kinase